MKQNKNSSGKRGAKATLEQVHQIVMEMEADAQRYAKAGHDVGIECLYWVRKLKATIGRLC